MLNEYINLFNEGTLDNTDCIDNIDDFVDLEPDALVEIGIKLDDSELLSPFQRGVAKNKIDFLLIFLTHFAEFTDNKAEYIKAISNVQRHQCVRSVDYKQKIPIGHKHDEQSWVFRELKLSIPGITDPPRCL